MGPAQVIGQLASRNPGADRLACTGGNWLAPEGKTRRERRTHDTDTYYWGSKSGEKSSHSQRLLYNQTSFCNPCRTENAALRHFRIGITFQNKCCRLVYTNYRIALFFLIPATFVIRSYSSDHFCESHDSLPCCCSLPHYPFPRLLLLTAGGWGCCSADLTVILAMTGNIHHSGASNVKHILPQLDQSQAVWTTKCPVMPYFDHIIGE